MPRKIQKNWTSREIQIIQRSLNDLRIYNIDTIARILASKLNRSFDSIRHKIFRVKKGLN